MARHMSAKFRAASAPYRRLQRAYPAGTPFSVRGPGSKRLKSLLADGVPEGEAIARVVGGRASRRNPDRAIEREDEPEGNPGGVPWLYVGLAAAGLLWWRSRHQPPAPTPPAPVGPPTVLNQA